MAELVRPDADADLNCMRQCSYVLEAKCLPTALLSYLAARAPRRKTRLSSLTAWS
jgi:hypothetical protein